MCSPKVNLTYLRFTEDTNICDNTIKNKLKNEVKELLKLLLNDKDKSNVSTVIKNHSLYEVPLKMNGLKLKTSNDSKVIELNTDPKYFNTDCNCKLSLNKSIPFDFTNSVIKENGLDVKDNYLMINYNLNSQYLPLSYSASKNLEFKTECPLKVKNKKLTLEYDTSDFRLNQGQLTLNQPYLHKNNNNTYTFYTTPINNDNSFFPMGGIDMGDNSTLNFHNNSKIIIDNTYVNSNGNCIPNNPKGDYNFYISIDKDGHPSFKQFPESDINNLSYMKEKYDALLNDYKELQITYNNLENEIKKYLPTNGTNDADMTSIIGTNIVYPDSCHPHDSTKDQSNSDNSIPTENQCNTSHCDPAPCNDVCDTGTCGNNSDNSCSTNSNHTTTTTTTSPSGQQYLRIINQSQQTQQQGTEVYVNNDDTKMKKPEEGYENNNSDDKQKSGGYSNLKFDFGDDNFFFINDDE